MTHATTIKLVDKIGCELDKKVQEWHKELLGTLQVMIMLKQGGGILKLIPNNGDTKLTPSLYWIPICTMP